MLNFLKGGEMMAKDERDLDRLIRLLVWLSKEGYTLAASIECIQYIAHGFEKSGE